LRKRGRTDFSPYLKNLSLNLSPKRRETLNFSPFPRREGGLGFLWASGQQEETKETRKITILNAQFPVPNSQII
jgi:hypothetical protein